MLDMDPFGSLLNSRGDDRAAASRQKSCNACVRGKRRCDKRTPRCSRCAAKGLDCVYQRMPPPSTPSHARPSAASSVSAADSASSSSSSACVPEFDMGFDMDSMGTDTSPESLQADPAGVGLLDLDFSIVDLLNAPGAGAGADLWNLQGYGENKLDLPPLPLGPPAAPETPLSQQQRQPIRDLSVLKANEGACMNADPLQVHDPRSRLGFVVEFLRSLPSTFARTRSLPFLHPRLWAAQLPRAILTAFSAATSYGARSPASQGWTLRLVADAAREINREGEAAATHSDKLARVQALLIINSVRLFDGDVGLRASAEREMNVLLDWIKELENVKVELEADAKTKAQRGALREPPKTWESWIFLESARRTVMAAYSFLCLFYILKFEEPQCEMWSESQSFTASKHLWEANSSVEFYRAWRDKPQFLIENLVLKDFWQYGRPADLDDFTRLMLTAQVGVDAMDHFMEGDIAIPV